MSEYITAIDVGTTGARTVIFDDIGQVVANSYQEYPIITPTPGWVEQDAEQWWRAVKKNTKAVFKQMKMNADAISAVVVTNQRETIVPVDRAGKSLNNAIVWQDRRTEKQCEEISQIVGAEDIYSITGLIINPYFSASKVLWIKEKKPGIYKKTHKFLLVHDYIVKKLTDEFATDFSNASRTMIFDINKFRWSNKLFDSFGISIDKVPQCLPSGTTIGEVTRKAALETGLVNGTPILAGGGDQQCAALGLGIIKEGLVKATTGTGTFVITHLTKPRLDPKKRVVCSASVIPNSWVLEASIFTTGAIYRWFRDNFADLERKEAAQMGIDVYELLNKKLGRSEPGASGLIAIPHFSGAGAPYWNPNAKGIIQGLTLKHSKADVLRALVEGVCFETKKSVDVFSELGLDVSELRVAGGVTRSKVWNQIQADIFNKIVLKTSFEETTALGAAIIGFVGTKYYKSFDEAEENMVAVSERYRPRKKFRKLYDELYQKNLELYRRITQ